MNKVLFICVHNSARSQMAEAYLNHLCPNHYVAESAGLEPGQLNPLVVKVMVEEGIDISGKTTQSAYDLAKQRRSFDHVIAVCDKASGERCPVFPGLSKRHQWNFPDPSAVAGPEEDQLAQIRIIRDSIRSRIESWCKEVCKSA
ncbi:MAG: arsenate reductase ArsC [Akkermansiaceae bacterium]|nr:arsenate reductase ArsC [Akkermansiaceae bacterium]